MQKTPSAVFIGQSPIDVIVRVDDRFLVENDIVKHSTKVIDVAESTTILKDLDVLDRIPGGGAANVASMFSQLHGMAIFNGKIADDDEGRLFLNSLCGRGVHIANDIILDGQKSDLIYTFITPDNERSFAACYDVSAKLRFDDLDTDCIGGADLLFLEGFLLNNGGGHDVVMKAAKHAKQGKAPTLVAFCPCDPQIIATFPDKINELLAYVDVLILNEHEARALYPDQDIYSILKKLQSEFLFGALTMGEKGAHAFSGDEIVFKPAAAIRPEEIVNTNGAGDAFSGGFLHSVLSGKPLSQSLEIAHQCAIEVLKRPGAR